MTCPPKNFPLTGPSRTEPSIRAPIPGAARGVRTASNPVPFVAGDERASWGHPNFLAGKKTFVTFERIQGRTSIAFRLDRVDIKSLTPSDEQFFATPYGRGQWISIAMVVLTATHIKMGCARQIALFPARHSPHCLNHSRFRLLFLPTRVMNGLKLAEL